MKNLQTQPNDRNTETFDYRFTLLKTLCLMLDSYKEIACYCINLATKNQLSELNEIFEDGDTIPFDINLLKAIDDRNIKLMVELLEEIEQTFLSLKMLNGIVDGEIKQAAKSGITAGYLKGVDEEEVMNYHFWLLNLTSYLHYCAFSFFCLAYQLTYAIAFINEEKYHHFYFPTGDDLKVLGSKDDLIVAALEKTVVSFSSAAFALD